MTTTTRLLKTSKFLRQPWRSGVNVVRMIYVRVVCVFLHCSRCCCVYVSKKVTMMFHISIWKMNSSFPSITLVRRSSVGSFFFWFAKKNITVKVMDKGLAFDRIFYKKVTWDQNTIHSFVCWVIKKKISDIVQKFVPFPLLSWHSFTADSPIYCCLFYLFHSRAQIGIVFFHCNWTSSIFPFNDAT